MIGVKKQKALEIANNMAIGFCVNFREEHNDWENYEEIGILFARLSFAKKHPTAFLKKYSKDWEEFNENSQQIPRLEYSLKIKPAISVEERHEIEKTLEKLGYNVWTPPTTGMSPCDIDFDNKENLKNDPLGMKKPNRCVKIVEIEEDDDIIGVFPYEGNKNCVIIYTKNNIYLCDVKKEMGRELK